MFFQAPDEGAGTDADLVAAGIEAVSEGNFAADNNATKLSFKTAASEAASEKMSLSSAGLLTVADDIVFKDGGTIGVSSATDAMTVSSGGIVTFKDDIIIKDGGTIGSASATGAMTVASTGIVTFVDDILIKDGGTIGSASSTSAITVASTGIVTFVDDILIKDGGTIGSASAGGAGIAADLSVGDDLRLISDSAVLNFGADSDVTLTHAADASLTLAGSTAAQLIMSTGSILPNTNTDTSNSGSVTLDFKTYQNHVLTFTGNVTLANPTTETAGQSGIIVCIQDGTGSRTLSLGTDYETAGGAGITLSTAANAVDVIPYFVKASGSVQLGAVQKAFS